MFINSVEVRIAEMLYNIYSLLLILKSVLENFFKLFFLFLK